jgi:GT2 family glycosyltransferase
MIGRALFEEVGCFSEDYFMYSDDVDLCYKVREKGRRNHIVPDARVVHFGGGSSSRSEVSTLSSVMMMESRWKYFRKTRTSFYAALFRLVVFLTGSVRLLLALVFEAKARLCGKPGLWRGSINKWRSRVRWAVGLEGWVGQYGAGSGGHKPA